MPARAPRCTADDYIAEPMSGLGGTARRRHAGPVPPCPHFAASFSAAVQCPARGERSFIIKCHAATPHHRCATRFIEARWFRAVRHNFIIGRHHWAHPDGIAPSLPSPQAHRSCSCGVSSTDAVGDPPVTIWDTYVLSTSCDHGARVAAERKSPPSQTRDRRCARFDIGGIAHSGRNVVGANPRERRFRHSP